ncbi:hypothetical protein RchiOBHm_Chr2g0174461 [Rosa chinensis]|uniref:Uncharacterized protein n=1 Tax=Rosa chinensis TaxID=74649 RepID=A0A2P6S664_ROSCH|nr:hypothetical protein RchiOBHm_Chr2g0174461 [Rosa chinensis]
MKKTIWNCGFALHLGRGDWHWGKSEVFWGRKIVAGVRTKQSRKVLGDFSILLYWEDKSM